MIKTLLLIACTFCLVSASAVPEDAFLNFTEIMDAHGYPYESHQIETDDGYLLTYFRMQAKYQNITSGKPVFLLMHGLSDSGDSWIYNYENNSLAYVLANKGFDVWIANSRGNKFSNNHKTLNPKADASYWDFSWQEMGEYDLPAAFEYIAKKTGQKINYVGHSQGTIQMFAALADQNPTVLRHLRKFAALGPVAYLNNMRSTLSRLLLESPLIPLGQSLGLTSMFEYNKISSTIGAYVCTYFPIKCKLQTYLTNSDDLDYDNIERYAVHQGHYPAGTSFRNLAHWRQIKISGKFQKYDHGTQENLKKYGQETPPEYSLEKATGDIMLFVTTADKTANVEDAQLLFDQLKKSKATVKIGYYPGGHVTFIMGKELYFLNDLMKFFEYEREEYHCTDGSFSCDGSNAGHSIY